MSLTLADVRARLKALNVFALVGGTIEMATARKAIPAATPACYVFPLADTASENESAPNGVSQAITSQFGVTIVVKNVSDAIGQAAEADLQVLVDAVRVALLGWQPEGTEKKIEFKGGALDSFPDQHVWWLEKFATGYLIYAF